MADLPAYTGPGGPCPKCGTGGVLTEWHFTGGYGNPKMAGRPPVCENRPDLGPSAVKGGHLCRLCKNCKYGWVEACADPGDAGEAGKLRAVPGPSG